MIARRLPGMTLAVAVALFATPALSQGPALSQTPALSQINAVDATRDAIARIDRLDPVLHAVIAIDPAAIDRARALDRDRRVRGPLFALPVLVKDNIDVAGVATTAGSLALAANIAAKDAPLVARLRDAGAVVLGKTNLSEWANFRGSGSISGWSAVGGQTHNPHVLDRSPCGSSSGSAVAVASGMVTAAIGTETDGSITCPAAMTGIVGLKPTVGLVSRAGIVPISVGQDTAGPMAADVRTAARLLAAIAGSDPADAATREADARRVDYLARLKPNALKGIRLGVVRFSGSGQPPVVAIFGRALTALRAAGAELVEIRKADIDEDAIGNREGMILDTEFAVGVDAYLATAPAKVASRTLADLIAFNDKHPRELALFGQETFVRAAATKGLTDPAYIKARDEARRMSRGAIDRLLKDNRVAALIAPTAPPAMMIDAVSGDAFPGGYGLGSIAAVAGYPHLTVPMGAVRSLPVGLSFIGTAWRDADLLAYGYAFEQVARVRIVPTMAPSVESHPDIAPLLAPPR